MAKKKKAYRYEWPRPGVTVDIALFTVSGALSDLRLQVLLVERDEEPWRGTWALPGGFVRENEDLNAAAIRELDEETGIPGATLEQVEAVGTPGRDTRGHVITIVYVGMTAGDRHELKPRGDARRARWFDVSAAKPLPELAFDHSELLRRALQHLRRRLAEAPVCFELLPETFTLSELQALTEAILGYSLDRRNFRRKVIETGLVAAADGLREGSHRPAQLFRFVPESFRPRDRPLPL
jgi:ADP-ribose pyrophosphatase YjhB (NUDIX family)